ncbi:MULTISPECIES: DfrD/DfrG/DfrK family trimethoprim-resistant dihydrofolate reductase [unclassified Peribacillus]|uniref:DfrD/DfrG/DfrK family trimethoprim-resistant dihydrofolate reductase n=1 Tax=unclassified Peribacillus TaxID=2675266 RepID=UPI0019124D26|nr:MULTISPECIES: DfrD/DfrG/DfrK family trimethoprim-resistant dihydrofolate reductase [unclassified Peribacillus]MBK5460147.1 DfrD/DfrG/DfrK family trimethoprim-resistant dihydrofolate reductase [Peribacillus sp. TH27]MBK5498336.1 DfrD/DfrG/DfrK family trimethoprim-resistant dihydrofolate reductase [Peribacillus sp. TH14]
MKFFLIVAMDKNRVIGKENDIPWRIPKDWQYVKKTTKGHPIILGRKNFESIGSVLPDRRNIILTRDKAFNFDGCEIAHSIKNVFKLCENEEEIFIFGGEQIYKMFLPYVERLYITKIHHEFEGDTFFPEINFNEWEEVSVEKGITDDENPYIYYFHVYERKNILN